MSKIAEEQEEVTAEDAFGGYTVHPAAALFPLLSGNEYDDLVRSMQQRGQLLPILKQGNVLLDGRNRMRVCIELNIEPWIEEYTGDRSPTQLIYDINMNRRHLTEDQFVMIIVEIHAMLRQEKQEAMRLAGERGKEGGRGNKKTPQRKSAEGFLPAPQTRDIIAAKAEVSRDKADAALLVFEHAPKEAEKVKQGKMPLRQAAQVAREHKPKKPKKPRPFNFETYQRAFHKTVLDRMEKVPKQHCAAMAKSLIKLLKDICPQST
jgi:hypothetical protein